MARSPKKSVPSKTGEISTPGNGSLPNLTGNPDATLTVGCSQSNEPHWCNHFPLPAQNGYENVYAKAVANLSLPAQNSGDSAPKKVIGRPFPPGVSGNPGGKPKSKPITEMLQRLFDEQGLTIYETMMGVFTGKSAVAKVMLLEKAAERLEGKVVQHVEGDINLNLGISDRLLRAKERVDGESSDS